MLAIQYDKHGGAEVLEYREVADPPPPGPGQILLRIRAASINHLDIHFRRGMPDLRIALPHIPGSDGAGVVAAVGPGVRHLREGDRVVLYCGAGCGRCESCRIGDKSMCHAAYPLGRDTDGTYAELMLLPAENALALPDPVSFEVGAAAPLVYTTAWRMLVTKAGLRAGQTVLVMSAGSGVGMAAVQIAKLCGATVFATVGSPAKAELAEKKLAPDAILRYTEQPIDQAVRALTGKRGVDVVIDHVGGPQWQPLLRATRSGGTIVTCGATAGYDPTEDLRHIFYRQLRILGSSLGTASECLEVMKLVYAGRLQPILDSVVPLAEAAAAQQRVESRQTFGKVVLTP